MHPDGYPPQALQLDTSHPLRPWQITISIGLCKILLYDLLLCSTSHDLAAWGKANQ